MAMRSRRSWTGPKVRRKLRKALSEAMSAKNIAFLLGAGCSSFKKDGAEVGIATIRPLAQEFCDETLVARAEGFYGSASDSTDTEPAEAAGTDLTEPQPQDEEPDPDPFPEAAPPSEPEPPPPPEPEPTAPWRLTKQELDCLDEMGVDLASYNTNLERLAEVLFSQRFVLRLSTQASHQPVRDAINGVIKKLQVFLLERLCNGRFANGDKTVQDLYERFYRKLVLRDRSLPRPWVFTTNYDVFNETAMDRLGIPYANGFSGFVERRFNPASFRYALAEQFDIGDRKWAAVDAFVYLCKLHGSVSWTEDDHGLFPIREEWPPKDPGRMLIYPTPAKQNSSLASPYADLFREFQSRIVREQSVLITAGYAFADEHVNNIIYQALTIPTFRLIIFASPDAGGDIAKLKALRDPRIWIIGGDGPDAGTRAHYFDTIVEHFMPQRESERVDDAIRKVLKDMARPKEDK